MMRCQQGFMFFFAAHTRHSLCTILHSRGLSEMRLAARPPPPQPAPPPGGRRARNTASEAERLLFRGLASAHAIVHRGLANGPYYPYPRGSGVHLPLWRGERGGAIPS